MSADDCIKLAKEARSFGGEVPPLGQRCYHCGGRALTYGQDGNGDAITDHRCHRCDNAVARAIKTRSAVLVPPRPDPLPRFCKYCYKVAPLIGCWCGPCAIRHNELARDRGDTSKEQAEATIAYLRSLMDGSIKPAADPDFGTDLLDVYNQTQEEFDEF